MKHLLLTIAFLTISFGSVASERKVEDKGIKCPKMQSSLVRSPAPSKSDDKSAPASQPQSKATKA